MSIADLALKAVAQYRLLPVSMLRGPLRHRHVARARQEACWLMRHQCRLCPIRHPVMELNHDA